MFTSQPMTANLSGLRVEYALALIYSSEAGKREATIGFDVGQGTQDLGFRGEVPVLFDVRPAVPVKLGVRDHDGTPTVAPLHLHGPLGPRPSAAAQAARPRPLLPAAGLPRTTAASVLLPPGEFDHDLRPRARSTGCSSREIDVPERGEATLDVRLERWIDPAAYGFYGGDHHIHAAGCAHYTEPDRGRRRRGHVPAGQGRGAERRLRPDLGPVLRLPAAVLRADGPTS